MNVADKPDAGDTAITPQPDGLKQGNSYGYPGLRSGVAGSDIKPKTGSPVNGKSAK